MKTFYNSHQCNTIIIVLPYLMYTTISITIIINISNNITVPIAPPIIAVLLASIVTVFLLGATTIRYVKFHNTILPVADVGYIITELDLLIVMLSSSSETDTETPNLVIIIWFSMEILSHVESECIQTDI